MILVLLALGCQRADPDLVAVRDAVGAWEEGVALLDAGEPTAAREAFERAHETRDDPMLLAWEAKAAAYEGDLDGAVALLDQALAEAPDLAEARYNRAAYKARRGDPVEEVAADLARAVEQGAVTPASVLDDPDFAHLLDDPAMHFLPESKLRIAVEAPTSTVFWGSEFSVRLRIGGAEDTPIALTAEELYGPITLLSVVDDSNPSTDGTFRDLTFAFRVVGAGTAKFGPIHAWVGERRAALDPFEVVTAAPEGKETAPDDRLIDLHTPAELAGRATAPSARFSGGDLLVMHEPADRVALSPEPEESPVRYEQRARGSAEWVLLRYVDADPATRVQVLRGGAVTYEGP